MASRTALEAALRRRRLELGAAPPLYVLGLGERGVTVRRQQVRAINVVHGLRSVLGFPRGTPIAIVGAGAGGLCAALAAALDGLAPTVFERRATLSTWRINKTRLLHPNLYSWPEPGWQDARAGVPLLDWAGGRCCEVAEELLAQWRPLSDALGVRPKLREVTRLRVDGGAWTLRHTDGTDTIEEGGFAACILAMGWGEERHLAASYGRHGYWADDPFDNDHPDVTWVVMGNGDGGLVDYLRLSLYDFRQAAADLVPLLEDGRLVRQVAAAEAEPDPVRRLGLYLRLDAPALDAWLSARLAERKSSVVLADRPWADAAPVPLAAKSFPLNRTLVARVLALRGLTDPAAPPPTLFRALTVDESGAVAPQLAPGERIVVRVGTLSPFPDELRTDLAALAGVSTEEVPRSIYGFDPSSEPEDPSCEVLWRGGWDWREGSAQARTLTALADARSGFDLACRLLRICHEGAFASTREEAGFIERVQREVIPLLGDRDAPLDLRAARRADWLRLTWRLFREGSHPAIAVAAGWANALDRHVGTYFAPEWRVTHGPRQRLDAGDGIPLAAPDPRADGYTWLRHLRLAPPGCGVNLHVVLVDAPGGRPPRQIEPDAHLQLLLTRAGTLVYEPRPRGRASAPQVAAAIAALGLPLAPFP